MEVKNKATKIDLFSLATPQMRTFHMTWFAFFLCFFGWFGIAPLMALVREDLMLTKAQIGEYHYRLGRHHRYRSHYYWPAVRPLRLAPGLYLVAVARLTAGYGDWPGAEL